MQLENASGQPEGQELPADTTQQNGTEPQSQEAKPERTFSQAEVNEIVAKRVAKLERQAKASDSAREIATLRSEIEALKAAKTPAESADDKPPKRDAYETYEEYVEARASYNARAEVRKEIDALRKERDEGEKKSKSDQRQKEYQDLVKSRVDAGRKEFPDFDAVMKEALEDEVIPRDSALWHGVLDSEIGHKLFMHLAKNPADARRMLSMSDAGQLRELGKLEDKLSAKKERGETMEPIDGRSPNKPGLRDDMSDEAWIKKRNADIRKGN